MLKSRILSHFFVLQFWWMLLLMMTTLPFVLGYVCSLDMQNEFPWTMCGVGALDIDSNWIVVVRRSEEYSKVAEYPRERDLVSLSL
jgi:hypothetical protein